MKSQIDNDVPTVPFISIIYREHAKYLNEKVKDEDLSFGLYPLLIKIYKNEGIIQEQLAQIFNLNESTITRNLKKLEDKGFIERIKQSQEFIEFSDMLVEDDSSATIKILDGNNNAVPIIGTHTTISHYKRDLEEFRSLFGAISAQPSNNTLLRFPELTRRSGFIDDNGQNQGHQQSHGFISHIVFATDAAVGTTDKTGKLRIIKT